MEASDTCRAVIQAFVGEYGEAPAAVVRAPGRVNLIGGHTDYNDGFVLPLAIEQAVWIALRPRGDGSVRLRSLQQADPIEVRLDRFERGGPPWGEYVRGVLWALERETSGALGGWEGVLGSAVPDGAGLSSSAALELCVARATAHVSALPWDPWVMARVCRRAEHEWVGVQCGIMDQLICAAGLRGHALLIDCRSGQAQPVPVPRDACVVLLDTGTRRRLGTSAYNTRRAECDAAAVFLGVGALRDVSSVHLRRRQLDLPPTQQRRARHVVEENARTLAAAEALRAGRLREVGELLSASHTSLRVDFEVSGPALDAMVDAAQASPGCLGARMTGAGFAGCVVALVEADHVDSFTRSVRERFVAPPGAAPELLVCSASDGASVVLTGEHSR